MFLGFLMISGFDSTVLHPDPLSPLCIETSSGAIMMQVFAPLSIVGSSAGRFHPCGVMYVAFFFFISSSILSSL